MKKLQKQFLDFNQLIKIDEETSVLRDKRDMLKKDIEDYFPDKCSEYGISVNKSDLRFIHQGSYKIGTTIKDTNVDLDYAVILPLNIFEHSDSREVKKAARDSLLIKNIRIPDIKEPCVTVAYHENGKEYMHIDFPIYADYSGLLYLARGKENSASYKWEVADPEGLNDYFLDKFTNYEQLRRVVRFLKKWKQEKYGNITNSHAIPPSVGLTILACENYMEYAEDDLSSLYYTLKAIRNKFSVTRNGDDEIISASITCNLPVMPRTDVFYKMRDASSHMITFYKRICSAVDNLQNAINLDEEHEAAKYVQKVLGADFEVPEKEATETFTYSKKEYGFG
ncbi:MAG: hypothetical protein E7425_04280 [Ruminococcaceae bacterium]|nr:hypothetical protein [Oscillospiraceae bacterium]